MNRTAPKKYARGERTARGIRIDVEIDGILCYDGECLGLPRARYEFLVKDPHTRDKRGNCKLVSQRFDDFEKGLAWSKDQWSTFQRGEDQAGQRRLSKLVPLFLEDLERLKLSPKHQRENKLLLESLIEAGLDDMRADQWFSRVQRWLDGLASEKRRKKDAPKSVLSDATRYRKRTLLVTFGNWLITPPNAYFVKNPLLGLKAAEPGKAAVPPFTVEEAKLLVSDKALDRIDGLYFAYRLYTGQRRLEALWARWPQLRFDSKRILVTETDATDIAEAERLGVDHKRIKTDPRVSIFPDELIEIIRERMEVRTDDAFVFPERLRSRAYKNENIAWYRHLEALGINPESPMGWRKPHSTRATNATLYLAAGLQQQLLGLHIGHESPETTKRYVAKAMLFMEDCKGWNGELYLRRDPPKRQEPKPGKEPIPGPGSEQRQGASYMPATWTKGIQGQAEEDGAMRPEDEIDGELFVILPDKSPIFTDGSAAVSVRSQPRPAPQDQIANPCTPVRFRSAPQELTTNGSDGLHGSYMSDPPDWEGIG